MFVNDDFGGGGYEQSQSKMVGVWAETRTLGLQNTKQESQKPLSVFFFSEEVSSPCKTYAVCGPLRDSC
jgi:hypothetical protein